VTGVKLLGTSAALLTTVALLASVPVSGHSVAQSASAPGRDVGIHATLDNILDLYVREGLVYYRALASERGNLDRYISNLDVPRAANEGWSRDTQAAFWLNAYNALVLRTVVNAYPIRGRSADYPSNSIRQVPGAFDRKHRVAGRVVTLDEIEKEALAAFDDPRMYFALGRGSIGGGRLRSEAFVPSRLEAQLASVAAECVSRYECFRYDQASDRVQASAIFGWRQDAFVRHYLGDAERFTNRSPIERAVLQLVLPHVLPGEREGLARNTFTMAYQTFDWRLNDLTDGGGR
jgi:hypothetical protein